jgi:transposase
MKSLTLSDPSIILGIQDELRRSHESRYDHRLHALLLIARGMSCPNVAHHFGESRTAVWGWVRKFEQYGFAGLAEGERTGRPQRLSAKHLQDINKALRKDPPQGGLWDGKTLSMYLQQKHGIALGVRQCQRLFRKLGFRLRKPRPMLAHSNPELQEDFKKNFGVS